MNINNHMVSFWLTGLFLASDMLPPLYFKWFGLAWGGDEATTTPANAFRMMSTLF